MSHGVFYKCCSFGYPSDFLVCMFDSCILLVELTPVLIIKILNLESYEQIFSESYNFVTPTVLFCV